MEETPTSEKRPLHNFQTFNFQRTDSQILSVVALHQAAPSLLDLWCTYEVAMEEGGDDV